MPTSSIEIRPQEDAQSGLVASGVHRKGLWEKNRFACILGGSAFVVVAFVIGMVCGFTGRSEPACSGDEFPSVQAELELGLNTMAKWFPANATTLHAKKDDIIHYIMDVTDPDEDSPLRQPMLVIPPEREPSANSQSLTLLAEPATKCTEAISQFLSDFALFLIGLMKFIVEEKLRFYTAILTWFQKNITPDQVQALIKQIGEITQPGGVKDRAKAMGLVMRDALERGATWVKLIFDSVVMQYRKNPWKATKICVKMAAQFTVWFGGGFKAFLGSASFQLLNNHSMISSGKSALRTCRNASTKLAYT
jgi:hypothetical protein